MRQDHQHHGGHGGRHQHQHVGNGGGSSSSTAPMGARGGPRPEEDPEYRFWLLSPLQLGFSQVRIAPQFQDGRDIEMAIADIRVRETSKYLLLEHPFPCIDVVRWRAKRRDPKPNSARNEKDNGGGEQDDDEEDKIEFQSVWKRQDLEDKLGKERWFTFDNRRLYCLQKYCVEKAAELRRRQRSDARLMQQQGKSSTRVSPNNGRNKDLSSSPPPLPIYILCREIPRKIVKEIRKFRTENNGDAVRIGHHHDECRSIWDWRVGKVCDVEQWKRHICPDPSSGAHRSTILTPELISGILRQFSGPDVFLTVQPRRIETDLEYEYDGYHGYHDQHRGKGPQTPKLSLPLPEHHTNFF
ncbi:unnamed protein product [Amoebophrya sp. A120]|nr:unnamed protein product [Amoebophrya sp. A120]|eukprot:GSA120T00005569001.1